MKGEEEWNGREKSVKDEQEGANKEKKASRWRENQIEAIVKRLKEKRQVCEGEREKLKNQSCNMGKKDAKIQVKALVKYGSKKKQPNRNKEELGKSARYYTSSEVKSSGRAPRNVRQ